MGSDKARRSYDAGRMYRSIVSQQGRVTVEADANEGEEIRAEEARAALVDVIGPAGAPADGFKISVAAGGGPSDFAIGAGALYVGGLRVVNADPQATYLGQHRTTWNGYPAEWLDYPAGSLFGEPAGGPLSELVYLTLTEQEVSAVEDPALREPALGGPDTAARTRLIQRVKRYQLFEAASCGLGFAFLRKTAYNQAAAFDPSTMRLTSRALLRVDFVPTSTGPSDPCQPTAQPGFLGPDNQLIRVQVSDRVDDQQQFLWGWDNASFIYRVTIPAPGPQNVVTLEGIPVDVFHQPHLGQRVELLDTAVDLGGGAYVASETGTVYDVADYDATTRQLTLTSAIPGDFLRTPAQPAFIRIWENQLTFAPDDTTAVELVGGDGFRPGVRIFAEASAWVPGDYWMIGVRPSTPMEILPARLKTPQPPDGPRRWLAPLAVINWPATGDPTVSDCRPPFVDLVELTQRKGGDCCELVVQPGEDIQKAIDALPDTGGAVCLKAGTHHIDQPIRITRSFVTLHGESGGTIVETTIAASGTGAAMLAIGLAGDQDVTDIAVRDIAFVVTKTPAAPGAALFVSAQRCTRGQIRGCRFTAPPVALGTTAMVLMNTEGCRDLTIADNRGEQLFMGIFAKDCLGQIDLLGNTLVGALVTATLASGATGDYVAGAFGILLQGSPSALAVARITHNRLENFSHSISLDDQLDRSTIADNIILRGLSSTPLPDPANPQTNPPSYPPPFPPLSDLAAMAAYLGARSYAVLCTSHRCTIRGNRIDLRSSWWGGIRTSGFATVIDANRIESTINVEQDRWQPAGIYCFDPSGAGGHRSRISDNLLDGPQAAITVTGCNEVEVLRNRIYGAGTAAHGVRLDNADGALVGDNDVTSMSTAFARAAIFASQGHRNRFEGNHVDGCTEGIGTASQTDVVIAGNRIEEASLTAIAAVQFDGTATICDNRALHCGFYLQDARGPVAITALGTGAASTLRIEGCEVVDLGIPPFGGSGPDRALAIRADFVASCQLVGNRVGYTDDTLKQFFPPPPGIPQARQPLMINGLALTGDNAPAGVVLISDNDLAGTSFDASDNPEAGFVVVGATVVMLVPGPSPAVVTKIATGPFRKVTFSNNVCRQVTKPDGNAGLDATVRVISTHLIAIGNHIEADDRSVTSIDATAASRMVLTGNVTSGQLVPPPNPNFNVIL